MVQILEVMSVFDYKIMYKIMLKFFVYFILFMLESFSNWNSVRIEKVNEYDVFGNLGIYVLNRINNFQGMCNDNIEILF